MSNNNNSCPDAGKRLCKTECDFDESGAGGKKGNIVVTREMPHRMTIITQLCDPPSRIIATALRSGKLLYSQGVRQIELKVALKHTP